MNNPFAVIPARSNVLKAGLIARLDQLNDFKDHTGYLRRDGRTQADVILSFYLREVMQFREAILKKGTKPVGPAWKGFISRKLTDEQKANFNAWDIHDDDVWLRVAQMEIDGNKFTSHFNKSNNTFNANFTCTDEASPNYGFTLSSFSPNWYQAIRITLFKHEVVYGGNWVTPDNVVSNDDWG